MTTEIFLNLLNMWLKINIEVPFVLIFSLTTYQNRFSFEMIQTYCVVYDKKINIVWEKI